MQLQHLLKIKEADADIYKSAFEHVANFMRQIREAEQNVQLLSIEENLELRAPKIYGDESNLKYYIG